MKKLNSLISIALLGFLTLACGTKKPETVVTTTKTKGAPTWIDNPGTVPGIVGVGIEQPNAMGDKMMQRETAMVAARNIIGKQLQARVQGAFNQLNQQYNTAGSDGKMPSKTEATARMIENTKREIVNVSLVGATPHEFWLDPDTKELYVLIVMDKDSADRAVKAAANEFVHRQLKTGGADLQDAVGRLDKILDASSKQ